MKTCHTFLLLIILPAASSACQAQELYLGQKPPGLIPERFAPAVFSEDEYSEDVYNILPAETACVFDRWAETGFPQGEIFISRSVDGEWTRPELFEVFKEYSFVFLPTISPDGKRWFFTSHTLPLPAGEEGQIPLFFIEKTDQGWSEPHYIGQHIHASATLDGTLFLMVEGRDRARPAYRKLVNGSYEDFEFVEPAAYFTHNDAHIAVDPEGRYIIFDSQSRPRIGKCGLFISFRKKSGRWTEPVSMGTHIRQEAAMAWISYDGRYLFFKSDTDVYWVDAKLVEAFKPAELK